MQDDTLATFLLLLTEQCTNLAKQDEDVLSSTIRATCNVLVADATKTTGTSRYLQDPSYASVELFPILFSVISLGIVVLFTAAIIIRTKVQTRMNRRRPLKRGLEMMREKNEDSWLGGKHDSGSSVLHRTQNISYFEKKHVCSLISETMPESAESTTTESKVDRPIDLKTTTDEDLHDVQPNTIANGKQSCVNSPHSSVVFQDCSDRLKEAHDHHEHKQPLPTRRPKNDEATTRDAVLSWRGIGCSYPSSDPDAEAIFTLVDASGALRTHELTAIMGASGSGKSTLLDIISGRKNLGVLEGDMSIEGKVVKIEEAGTVLKRVAAYVPQNEMFFPTQTPEEAVSFFANLRLGRDKRGHAYRQYSISSLLDQVGLSTTARTRPIGGTLAGGLTIRGPSGGERKRLALACAVAMRPAILFLDEITRQVIF